MDNFIQDKTNKFVFFQSWLIILCGGLFYCFQFILRVSPNVMFGDIKNNFNIDNAKFGTIVSLYYWGYSLMQIPMGIIMDILGPRLVLGVSVLLCGFSSYLFSITNSYYIGCITRVIMGISASSSLMGAVKIGSSLLPPSKVSFVTAVTIALGTIGASIAGKPMRYVLDIVGWKNLHLIFLITSLLLSILFTFSLKSIKYQNAKIGLKRKFLNLFKVIITPQSWILGIFGGVMYMPITVMGMAWGVQYLQICFDISISEASSITTVMFFGAALGGSLFAYLSDILKSRKGPMYIGGIVSLFIWIYLIFFMGHSLTITYVLFFLAGIFYTSKILTFACNVEIHCKENNAVAVGFTSMLAMMMGAFSHFIVGHLLKFKSQSNLPVLNDYKFALSVVPVSIFFGLLLLSFIGETYPKKNIKI